MNIFYFSDCPIESAQAQPDKMLVKMPLETAQMLSTAHRELDGNEYADANGLYKTAYKNHPCTIWARESSSNYWWLVDHFLALSEEYKYRYGREHASFVKLERPLCRRPRNIKVGKMTPVAQAMPDQYKNKNPIKAYRDYCINEKTYAQWNKNRAKPIWWTQEVVV